MWARAARPAAGLVGRRRSKGLGYYYAALKAQEAAASAGTVPALPEPAQGVSRTRAYLDLQIGDAAKPARIELELADDVVPETVENFLQLCKGSAQDKNGYIGSSIHKVRRGFGIIGGDYLLGTGRGGRSASGKPLADENFVGRHSEAGTISMANSGVDSATSVFFISTAPAPHLDARHVVFGRVTAGLEAVEAASAVLQVNGRPAVDITIQSAGTLAPPSDR